MPGTGLPIPKDDNVLPLVTNAPSASTYSVAQSWANIAQSAAQTVAADEKIAAAGAQLATEGIHSYKVEQHQTQIAATAEFDVRKRTVFTEARDRFTGDPDGFKQWSDAHIEGALGEVPSWMLPHAKQFLSREADSKYAAILGERRAQDKHLETQSITARIKMADDDVMALASNNKLGTPEGIATVATYKGVLDSAVNSKMMDPDHAQLLVENLTTRSQGATIRNSVEQVYREKGYEAAREHLDKTLTDLGGPYRIQDQIRNQTLGWLRSEEAGMRGERDAISKEWAAAKPNIATLDPAVLQDMQSRAYGVGAYKVGDDIQAHSAALRGATFVRQLPVADQLQILKTGNLESRLTQRESSGDPTSVNKQGYAGLYQFGAPRLQTLGVYTPGPSENIGAWSKTAGTAPGKWTGTFNVPGFADVKTLDDFLKNPEAQKAVYGLHQQRTDQEIDKLDLGQYVGQTVGGVPITRDGIRAMVHLGGAEGARAFLTSGGVINPRDQLGTSLGDYARLGSPTAAPGDLTSSRPGLLALGMLKRDLTQDLTKKITDLQSAIGKTEFPAMDEVHALGAQVNLLGNQEQKRQVAEMAAQAEYGAKFVQLPKAQREELIGRWNEKLKLGAPDYERRLFDTVKTANGHIDAEYGKDPYGAAYRFSEGIAALPAIDWSSPNVGEHLAVKVAQQNTIRADQSIPVFSALRPGEAQALGAQLVSGDARQSKAMIGTLAANLPADIYRATITDAPIKNALDGMVRSYDPGKLDLAMSTLNRAWHDDPTGFAKSFEGSLPRLQTWLAHKDSLTPDQMVDYFKRADDPATHAARERLDKEAQTLLERTTPLSALTGLNAQIVANQLGSFADRWVPFINQAPPVDPLQGGVLLTEYEHLFRERYVDTVDEKKAREQAVERLKTVWGPTVVANGALMKHPPEKYYPQVDNSYDWMKRDLESSIAATRLGDHQTSAPLPEGANPSLLDAPFMPRVPSFTYKLVADGRTEADVAAKRPPSYSVVVRDTASGRDMVPLDWNGNRLPMRFTFDLAAAQAAAGEKFSTITHPAAIAGREALENIAASPMVGG